MGWPGGRDPRHANVRSETITASLVALIDSTPPAHGGPGTCRACDHSSPTKLVRPSAHQMPPVRDASPPNELWKAVPCRKVSRIRRSVAHPFEALNSCPRIPDSSRGVGARTALVTPLKETPGRLRSREMGQEAPDAPGEVPPHRHSYRFRFSALPSALPSSPWTDDFLVIV